jgi:hypothetical protein
VLLALAALLATPVAAYGRPLDGPTRAAGSALDTPAEAQAALDADPRSPDFCIAVQQRGTKYRGVCPIGAPALPMWGMNKGFVQLYRPQLHRQLRKAGLRTIEVRDIERDMRRLDRLDGDDGEDRIYDWAKDSPNPGAKDKVMTCLVYGVTAAVIAGVLTVIVDPKSVPEAVFLTGGGVCAGQLVNPYLRRFLERRGIKAEE